MYFHFRKFICKLNEANECLNFNSVGIRFSAFSPAFILRALERQANDVCTTNVDTTNRILRQKYSKHVHIRGDNENLIKCILVAGRARMIVECGEIVVWNSWNKTVFAPIITQF